MANFGEDLPPVTHSDTSSSDGTHDRIPLQHGIRIAFASLVRLSDANKKLALANNSADLAANPAYLYVVDDKLMLRWGDLLTPIRSDTKSMFTRIPDNPFTVAFDSSDASVHFPAQAADPLPISRVIPLTEADKVQARKAIELGATAIATQRFMEPKSVSSSPEAVDNPAQLTFTRLAREVKRKLLKAIGWQN